MFDCLSVGRRMPGDRSGSNSVWRKATGGDSASAFLSWGLGPLRPRRRGVLAGTCGMLIRVSAQPECFPLLRPRLDIRQRFALRAKFETLAHLLAEDEQ